MERLRQQYRRGRWWPLVAWLVGALVAGPAMAGPRGGRVVAGEAQITAPDVSITHIQQTSQRVFIDFDSYDVGVDESVIYSQPGRSAIAVNRILDHKPSEIFGTLKADGTIFLVNSRGIIFGESATLDVGGLVASGLSISLDDFLNGEYRFEDVRGGLVVNRGLIQAATGGSVTLLGNGVSNLGLIEAELGSVTLAAGSRAHLIFDMDGLIGVEIDQGVTQALPELEALVSNQGRITAEGGRVVLTGATASGLFDTAVNNEGVIQAGRIEKRGGKVMLLGSGADVSVAGTIDVSARDDVSDGGIIRIESDALTLVNDGDLSAVSAAGAGGDIRVLGDRVGLVGNTRVDVSGGAGGGHVNVGGNFRGEGPLLNASRTLVGADVSVLANALLDGDGGEIIVWSDDYTIFRGSLVGRGAGSGSGGFAEISSPNSLVSTGTYDLSADSGIVGTLLFDPDNIVIQGGTADGSDDTASDSTLLHAANPEGTV
ncbi:MAG: filamentous hemagglutinin N-terminal domain-containing protein, partial [Gammaproteobacteria bacterium]|nr:filamentous hemagglutinin N-terminal domain-containing protein [Gammaproteobacteria bacterium]